MHTSLLDAESEAADMHCLEGRVRKEEEVAKEVLGHLS